MFGIYIFFHFLLKDRSDKPWVQGHMINYYTFWHEYWDAQLQT